MLRRITLVCLVALACGAAASDAWARADGTVTYDGNTLVYTDAPGDNDIDGPQLAVDDAGKQFIKFADYPTIVDPGGECVSDTAGFGISAVYCPFKGALHFILGDGNDSLFIGSDIPAGTPVLVEGGDGNDSLSGANDETQPAVTALTLLGGAGDDELEGGHADDRLEGGDGNDQLAGDGGNDTLLGGDGNDGFQGDTPYGVDGDTVGSDYIDGGAGTDSIPGTDNHFMYGWQTHSIEHPLLNVTLDGQANDGKAGENDNVVNVENITIDAGSVTGDDGPNQLTHAAYDGDVTLNGAGGDDVLQGSDGSGDTLVGGAGNDSIAGEGGDDTITGGPGQDTISADGTSGCIVGPYYGQCTYRAGNDTIDVDDGEKDIVDCGPGDDTVKADALDSLTGCETITGSRVAGSAPAAQTPSCAGVVKAGTSLHKAKIALRAAGCRLGAIHRPTHHRGALVVARSKVRHGAVDVYLRRAR